MMGTTLSDEHMLKIMHISYWGAMDLVFEHFPDVFTIPDDIFELAKGYWPSFFRDFTEMHPSTVEEPSAVQALFLEFFQYGYDSFTRFLEKHPDSLIQFRRLPGDERSANFQVLTAQAIAAYCARGLRDEQRRLAMKKKRSRGLRHK